MNPKQRSQLQPVWETLLTVKNHIEHDFTDDDDNKSDEYYSNEQVSSEANSVTSDAIATIRTLITSWIIM